MKNEKDRRVLAGVCKVCGATVKIRNARLRTVEFHLNLQNEECEAFESGKRIPRESTRDEFLLLLPEEIKSHVRPTTP